MEAPMSDFNSRDFARADHLQFYKSLRDVDRSGGRRFGDIFADFLTLAATTFYMGAHKMLTGKIPKEIADQHRETDNRYDKEQGERFARALGILVESLEADLHDFLGQVFSVTNLGSPKGRGQVFTPTNLCEMMAKMTVGEAKPDPKHRFTVLEPAVGGGAMLLAAVKEFKSAGFAPKDWWFDAVDIDLRCFQMSYIQLTLAGAPGVVRHGDFLSGETWLAWPTLTGAMFPHVRASAPPPTPTPTLTPPKTGQLFFDYDKKAA
jgi:hypothetical protein